MHNDRESAAQWVEAQHRIRWQARNQAGRCALAGEFMVLNHRRSPVTRGIVEALCASLNRDWAKGQR